MESTQAARSRSARPSLRAAFGLVTIVVLSAAYLDYVFQLRTGIWLRFGLGDWIDPYLINALLEQWSYSVRHFANPISPPMFFPQPGTLGYSHSLVLYAPFYVIARAALHPFVADTVTILTVIEVGILSLYAIFRRFLTMGVIESLLLVTVFATSRNVINLPTGAWTQRASIFLVPAILLIGLTSAQRRPGPLRSLGLGVAAFLWASLFTHDIYTGLLSSLVALLLLVGALLCDGPKAMGIRISIFPPRRPFERVHIVTVSLLVFLAIVGLAWAWVLKFDSIFGIAFAPQHRHWERPLVLAFAALAAAELLRGGARGRIAVVAPPSGRDVAAIAAGAALGCVGLVWVYHIAFAQHHGFPQQQAISVLVQRNPADWPRIFSEPGSWLPYESGRSFAIVFALAAACCMPWLRLPREVRLSALWLAGVALIVLIVSMRIGDFALWRSVSGVPGFSAVRDPKRIIYPFELAVVVDLGVLLARLPRASLLRRAVFLFIAAIIVLRWNTERFDYARPIDAFELWVDRPIAVDASCRSFFIARASAAYMSRSPHMAGLYGTDAEFIATKYAIPTLNGYSAWEPPDWYLRDPLVPYYLNGVDDWISRNHLHGVCKLDIDKRTMTPYQGAGGLQP